MKNTKVQLTSANDEAPSSNLLAGGFGFRVIPAWPWALSFPVSAHLTWEDGSESHVQVYDSSNYFFGRRFLTMKLFDPQITNNQVDPAVVALTDDPSPPDFTSPNANVFANVLVYERNEAANQPAGVYNSQRSSTMQINLPHSVAESIPILFPYNSPNTAFMWYRDARWAGPPLSDGIGDDANPGPEKICAVYVQPNFIDTSVRIGIPNTTAGAGDDLLVDIAFMAAGARYDTERKLWVHTAEMTAVIDTVDMTGVISQFGSAIWRVYENRGPGYLIASARTVVNQENFKVDWFATLAEGAL